MRLLTVTHYFADHGGGIERVAGELATRLAKRGVDVTWMASGPTGDETNDDVTRVRASAWNVTERRLGAPWPIWGPVSLWRLWRAVRQHDAVHAHDCLYLPSVVSAIAAWWHRKPLIVTQHVGLVPYRSRIMRTLMEAGNRVLGRLVLGRATRAIFISDRVREYFEQRVRFRTEPLTIYNGVDRSRFFAVDPEQRLALRERLGLPADRPVLLFVGRFVEKKGLDQIHRVAQNIDQATWVFAGSGPLDPEAWNLSHVRSLGAVDHADVNDLYRAADLLVLPSVGEGFPLVAQESMACGAPVLTTPQTAAGIAGVDAVSIVCEPDVDTIARFLRDFLQDDRDRRAEVSAFAERWDWERCADDYLALLTGSASEGSA